MTRSRGLVWPILLVLLCIALGVAVLFKLGDVQERALMGAVAFREGRTPQTLIQAAQWITWTGDAAQRSIVMVAFALWLWLRQKRPRAALVMLVTPPLAGVTSTLLKEAFSRPRPSVVEHLDLVTSFSYPSGHSVNAMAVLLLGGLLLARRHRAFWVALAIMAAIIVGASRAILGVHYPSDIIGGWLLGGAFALIGWRVATAVEANAPVPDEPPALSPALSHSPPPRSDGLHPEAEAAGSPQHRA